MRCPDCRQESLVAFSVEEGRYVVTDRPGVLVMLDPHDALGPAFASEVEGRAFVQALLDAGVEFADELPDETFKVPER